jgi:hypothetical protein
MTTAAPQAAPATLPPRSFRASLSAAVNLSDAERARLQRLHLGARRVMNPQAASALELLAQVQAEASRVLDEPRRRKASK